VTTDVRIRGEVRHQSEWLQIRGVEGILGGPRHYGNAPGHQEPLVIPLLFDPGALDHRVIVRDQVRARLELRMRMRMGMTSDEDSEFNEEGEDSDE